MIHHREKKRSSVPSSSSSSSTATAATGGDGSAADRGGIKLQKNWNHQLKERRRLAGQQAARASARDTKRSKAVPAVAKAKAK